MINIKGLNKAEVLKALYDYSHISGLGVLQAVPKGTVTVEYCEELLKTTTYFDYLHGRVLKVDLSRDEFDELLYDIDCGIGTAKRAVDSVRNKTKETVNEKEPEENDEGLFVEIKREKGSSIVQSTIQGNIGEIECALMNVVATMYIESGSSEDKPSIEEFISHVVGNLWQELFRCYLNKEVQNDGYKK